MEYGGYFVYVFFMLLLVFWGRRIAQSEFPFLTKLLIIFGLFVFFALGGSRWQELWILLWPQWALAFGFLLGSVPYWFELLPKRSHSRKRTEKHLRESAAEIKRQKQAAEDDLRRQARQMEQEASERIRREKEQAEANLRKEAERVKREADEKVRQAREYAREQQRQAQEDKAKAQPDPYEVLGVNRDATKAEIKSAYRKLAAKYHPDKAVGATDEIRKLAEEKFKEIRSAYDAFSAKQNNDM